MLSRTAEDGGERDAGADPEGVGEHVAWLEAATGDEALGELEGDAEGDGGRGEEKAEHRAPEGEHGEEGEQDVAEEVRVLIGEVCGRQGNVSSNGRGGEGGGDDHDDGCEPEGVSEAANVEQGGHLSSFGRRSIYVESIRSPFCMSGRHPPYYEASWNPGSPRLERWWIVSSHYVVGLAFHDLTHSCLSVLSGVSGFLQKTDAYGNAWQQTFGRYCLGVVARRSASARCWFTMSFRTSSESSRCSAGTVV